jgi:hypothetical protein
MTGGKLAAGGLPPVMGWGAGWLSAARAARISEMVWKRRSVEISRAFSTT